MVVIELLSTQKHSKPMGKYGWNVFRKRESKVSCIEITSTAFKDIKKSSEGCSSNKRILSVLHTEMINVWVIAARVAGLPTFSHFTALLGKSSRVISYTLLVPPQSSSAICVGTCLFVDAHNPNSSMRKKTTKCLHLLI
ncbi:unnamed protein product [Albugo candida]|uniref:Uncharacterized protein n=1 Tax=Albugo candida TaxID=65357 RepID=A0A024FX31_9STRA|nr:unnamed protein product [Albugo candida]|eukprot:CCI11566.1 unnamed protein product [Albugo candida]